MLAACRAATALSVSSCVKRRMTQARPSSREMNAYMYSTPTPGGGQSLHRGGEPRRLIRNSDGQHAGQRNRQPRLLERCFRLEGLIHNNPQNAEIGGVRDGQGADIDACAGKNRRDFRQPSRLILNKNRKLFDKHKPQPFLRCLSPGFGNPLWV